MSTGFWTPEREARLKRLVTLKISERQIALVLGCTQDAVHGKLWRMAHPWIPKLRKIPVKRLEKSWDERLTERWADRRKSAPRQTDTA